MPITLPDALLDAGAYPEPPGAVELRETHISWVFLAGRRAYKVKKPVVLPFVDYGTLARRRAACAAEVRLNRRFAPGIYAGVVSVVPRGPAGLAIAQECDPRAVEYAVEMRRYDESATVAARLAAGTLTEADAAAVGAAVAGWHAAAPQAAGGAQLLSIAYETLDALAGAVEQRRVAALKRFFAAALTGLEPELDRRAHAGAVRDGHGDLRAEHVLLGDGVHAVDGLEFDPGLRATDAAYDLAFLVMDVARRDDRLARAVLRGYVAAGGDPGSERLLAVLCALRALVRAKVDVLRAAQLHGDAAAARRRRAADVLAVGERFAWRARLPAVTCVAGLAASGKSTLAAALADAGGRRVVSSDRVRKARAGVAADAAAPAAAYGERASRAVYRELGRLAADAVRRDGGVVVDATFRRPADVAAFASAAPPAEAGWIACRAPAAVLIERARRRTPPAAGGSDAGAAVVAAQIAQAPPLRLPHPLLAEVDTTRPVGDALDALARTLDARLAIREERGFYGAAQRSSPDARARGST